MLGLIRGKKSIASMEIYKHPLYYEIAFSFFDPREQIDTFERIIKKFSKVKVRRFLDIGCGPSLQLREIAKRGYKAIGLDLRPEMLSYLEKKAREEGITIKTVLTDMTDFRLKEKVDFAFIMMGSLVAESNEQFLSHLDSVAASLKQGGLYFIQNWGVDWTKSIKQNWTMEREGIVVETTFEFQPGNILSQIGTEKITLDVNDHGHRRKYVQKGRDLKIIFPQEFKTLIRLNGKFEFLGWREGTESTWYLDRPLEKAKTLSNINMVLLRRK